MNIMMQKFFIFTTLLLYGPGKCQATCSYCIALNGGQPFRNCVTNDTSIITREGSTVTVVLTVDIASITYEWLEIKRRTYNGKICGPTIRVKKGDTLKILLTNQLGDAQSEYNPNELQLPNTTNIHLHGLHISPEAPGNDMFTRVDPGQSHNYTYQIDKDQPAGTYWYHANWHGSSWFHVMSGLSGLLVVDDDVMPKALDKASCPNNCENDIHILMQSTLQYVNNGNGVSFIKDIQEEIGDSPNFRLPIGTEGWLMNPENNFNHYTVNGLYLPQLTIDKNELKRFRLVNAGGYDGLELEIVNPNTNPVTHPCVTMEIAHDGIYFKTPRNQNMHQTYLTVGARVDWLIYCNKPGTYMLRSFPKDTNTYSIGEVRRFKGQLMTIVVEESSLMEPSYPVSLPPLPHFVGNMSAGTENRFTVEFSDDFYINRKKFESKTDFRYQFEVGSVQEWTFLNTLKSSSHPIHIHVNHFQVISYNDYTGPISEESVCYSPKYPTFLLRAQDGRVCDDTYATPSVEHEVSGKMKFNHEYLKHKSRWGKMNSNPETTDHVLGYARRGDWRDVLNLPPLSNITVRFLADKYNGTIVVNCHVLKHEDMGMMITLQAIPKGGNTNNSLVRKLGCVERVSKNPCGTNTGYIVLGTILGLSVSVNFGLFIYYSQKLKTYPEHQRINPNNQGDKYGSCISCIRCIRNHQNENVANVVVVESDDHDENLGIDNLDRSSTNE